jgi:hypothetical protein
MADRANPIWPECYWQFSRCQADFGSMVPLAGIEPALLAELDFESFEVYDKLLI